MLVYVNSIKGISPSLEVENYESSWKEVGEEGDYQRVHCLIITAHAKIIPESDSSVSHSLLATNRG